MAFRISSNNPEIQQSVSSLRPEPRAATTLAENRYRATDPGPHSDVERIAIDAQQQSKDFMSGLRGGSLKRG